MSKKILIVGGVAGGATAAARLRRLDENAEVILFERGEYISFANCGLPYYIGGVIANRNALFVARKEDVAAKYKIDIRTEQEVTRILRDERAVEVKNLKTGEIYKESYDELLLSTGSSPIVPPLPGIKSDNVFTLWNIPDTDKVYNFIQEQKPRRAIVVGAGFIGLEMAENLRHLGMEVTVVELMQQVLAPLDPDMAILIENHMRDQGVELMLGKGLESITENGKYCVLSDGTRVPADLILLAIGVRANSSLAKEAGLELNARGGIVTDAMMLTSDPHIYAVGDAAEVPDFNTGVNTMVPLAGPANKQGRMVAGNILGNRPEAYTGTQGTSIAKIFELTAASTGLNEKSLQRAQKQLGQDYQVVLIHSGSHAGYYPNALQMTLKLIFDLKGKVLGAQIVGFDGVDKRIDVIAAAMRFGATVDDLTKLELAYAPPFSSAKDPVNMVGFVAQNILEGRTTLVLPQHLDQMRESYRILDVREDAEINMGKIPGSIHIPLTTLRQRYSELDPQKAYLVYCAVGARGYFAEQILRAKGFNAANLAGGFRSWRELNREHHSGPKNAAKQMIDQEGRPLPGHEAAQAPCVTTDAIKLEDLCGLSCPGPIVEVNKLLAAKASGECIRVVATDPGFARDIESWCDNTNNALVEQSSEHGKYYATIQKGNAQPAVRTQAGPAVKEKTMIVFSGDLDKAIAAFIIANGAAAMGNKVNLFFTFWGLSILRKPEKVGVAKDFMGKMFGFMLPRGSRKLKLSQMNFGGAGAKMIRGLMKSKNVASLESLIEEARKAGVKLTACQMSMDLMGIRKEELMDGVEIGGVAAMLNDNDHSNMNLFI